MAMVGYEFQPGSDDEMRRRLNAQNGTLGPMSNEALKIISMHLPSLLSGRPISPLLGPHVGGVGSTFAAGGGGVGAPGGSGGGSSELSQLMNLISTALHSTPPAPGITPGGQLPAQPWTPGGPPSSGPVGTAPGPTNPQPAPSPIAAPPQEPHNPFGDQGRNTRGGPFGY